MTETISCGPPTAIAQTTAYALPPCTVKLFTTTTTAVIKQANVVAMTGAITITLDANGEAELAGGFIQCTSGAITVTLKRL